MTDRYDEQTVLAYIEGDLPEAEAHAFKLKMLTDAELRTLVEGLEADRATLRTLPLEEPPIDLMEVVNDQLERQLLLGGDADELDRQTGHRRLRFARVGSYLALAAMFILGVGLLYQAMVDMTGEATFNDRGLVAYRDAQREGDEPPSGVTAFKAPAPLSDETPQIAAAETGGDEAGGDDSDGAASERLQLAMARKSTAANERMDLLMDAPSPATTPAPAMRARGVRQEESATAKLKDAPEAFGALAMEASPPPSNEPPKPMVARLGTDDDVAAPLAEAEDLKVVETIQKADADKERVLEKSDQTMAAMAAEKIDAARFSGVSATTIDTLQAANVIAEAAPADAIVGVDGIAKMVEPAAVASPAAPIVKPPDISDAYRDTSVTTATMAAPPEIMKSQPEVEAKGEGVAAVSGLMPQAKPALQAAAAGSSGELPSTMKRQVTEAEAKDEAAAEALQQHLTVLLDTDDMERTFGRIALWATRHKVTMQAGQSNEAMDITDITVVISPDQFRVLLNSLARDKRHTARIASSDSEAARIGLLRTEDDNPLWRSAADWLKEKKAKDSFVLDDDGLMAVPIIIRKKK